MPAALSAASTSIPSLEGNVMRRSWLVIGTLAVALATSSACGPFDASSSNAGGTPIGGPSSASGTPAVAATEKTSTGGAATDVGGDAQFCALAKEKGAQNLEVFDAQSSTPQQLRQVLLNIDALAAAAPEEIHADFARFDEFEHKLFDAGGNPSGDLAQEAGGEELRDSLARIAAYLDQHCGIHS
jgi:hypothetical protein